MCDSEYKILDHVIGRGSFGVVYLGMHKTGKLVAIKTEVKVAQLAGFVSDKAAYHHGEMSLTGAIVGMAQNFVGSNNINMLVPAGQFGSRIKGGKDASSPRYIFTQLEKITRCIFTEQDDHVLKYLTDDGTPVEPQFYGSMLLT